MIDKLLSKSDPWVKYAIRKCCLNENDENLITLKTEALNDSRIQDYLCIISRFHEIKVTNHKNPELPIHVLHFLLDIGLSTDVPQIQAAINQILIHKDKNGIYQSLTNIPKHYGGSGLDTYGWCLCDAPLLLLALIKAKVNYEKHIKSGVDYLISFASNNGFFCTVSEEFGKFRGPGRKDDCCPYATLIMLKLLSEIDEYKNSPIAYNCIETILLLWENSREKHPYMFYMGTDFRKLKAPAMWYDILHVVDCLSKYDYVKTDTRFIEMVNIIKSKQSEKGLFVPESVYQKNKKWDFGQKKEVSPYLSFLCLKVLSRV